MKTIKLLTPIAIALAVLTASPDAEQQVAKELEPSLTSFKAVSTSMPDFRGVTFYQAFPDSRGSLVQGIGHSNAVRGWFYQMNQMVSQFAKSDNKLALDVAVYADTVREEGEKVLGATGYLNKALNSLNRATSGKVMDLLALYN